MAEVKEHESTQKKILDLVDRSDKDPGNDVTFLVELNTSVMSLSPDSYDVNLFTGELKAGLEHAPSNLSLSEYEKQKTAAPTPDLGNMDALRDIDIPKSHVGAVKLNNYTSKLDPKQISSVSSLPEFTNQNTAILKIKSGKNGESCDFDKLKGVDSLKPNSSTSQLEPKQKACPSVSSSPEVTNHKIDVFKINSANRNALRDIDLPKRRAVSLERKSCSSKLKSKFGRSHSVSSSFEHTNQMVESFKPITKKIPALLDLVIPRPHPDFIKLNNIQTRKIQPKRGNVRTAANNYKQRNQKIAAPKSNRRQKTLSYHPDKAHRRGNKLKLSPGTNEVKPIQGKRPSVSSKPESRNNTQQTWANVKVMNSTINVDKSLTYADVLKGNNKFLDRHSECKNIPVALREIQNCETHTARSLDTESKLCPENPKGNDDALKMNNDCMKLQTGCEILPEGSSGRGQRYAAGEVKGQSLHPTITVQERKASVSAADALINHNSKQPHATVSKIPALLDLRPRPHPDFIKLNFSYTTRQFKPKRGHFATASRNPKERNQKIVAQKSNERKKTLSCNSDKGRKHANRVQLNPQTKESKTIPGKRPSVSIKADSGNNKKQMCANGMVMNSTINVGKPFTYADVLKGNNKFPALQSKCENIPASFLQVSPTPQEQKLRLNRLARFLSLSIKPWFQIVDTAQHDNNDNIVQHDGQIQQESNQGRLPSPFQDLQSDGGPVTPELYRDESFGWNWPLTDIPEWTIGGSGQHL